MLPNRQKTNRSKEKQMPREAAAGEIIGDCHYTVERIKSKRTRSGCIEYLVEWTGFPGEDTWQKIENLQYVTELVEQYEQSRKMEKRKKKTHVFTARRKITEVREEKQASVDSSKGQQKESISKYCYTLKKQKDVQKPQQSAPQLSRKEQPSIDKPSVDKPSIDKPQPTGRFLMPVSITFSGEKLQPRSHANLPSHPIKLLKPASISFQPNPNKDLQTSIPEPFTFQ